MATRPTRKLKTAPKAIPTELTAAATKFYTHNNAANAASNAATKARKELYGGMKKEGIKSFDFETNIDGEKIMLAVEVSAGSREGADATALYALFKKGRITEDQFLSVISASKGAVEAKLGKDIFAQVAVATATAENANVKPKK